jgi:putative nucleotidyltransferase with HDIG domain
LCRDGDKDETSQTSLTRRHATVIPALEVDGQRDGPGRSSAAWAGAALEACLRARAPGLHASTPLVRKLAAKVGQRLGLDGETSALLDLSVRVRDVGMVALPDTVVLAQATLSPADWELVNRHPVIGADLLDELGVTASCAPIVRAHHERWDGGGYPDGLSGESIPLLSRVIATCDAFVAIASDRPHRRGIGAEAALEQVCQGRDTQFDGRVVDALVGALTKRDAARPAARASAARAGADQPGGAAPRRGGLDLARAMAQLDPLPAFAPACDRLIESINADATTAGEIVAMIETDTGLTVAVLRRAATVEGSRPITNVADAVAALGAAEIERVIASLPRAEFPWRTSQLEVLMHRTRVHAQAVARAADRIVQEVQPAIRDDVLAVALLHDIGTLLIGRAHPDYDPLDARTSTPEERLRHEQRMLRMDHASLGALLLRKWGLPSRLATAVGEHHTADATRAIATYVRLADMVAHHAQGEHVDRTRMLRLGEACGLSATALAGALFDLPHSGGSQRRRAEPSPLSTRETTVLRVLAQGKVYKTIALELGLSASTVRTHLHNAYAKLGVVDRAQAVLRAAEMGWI